MKEVRLGDICNIKSSKRIYQSEYTDKGVPFYRGKEISELCRGENPKVELHISRDRYNELESKFGSPKKGDLLITSVGTIGNTWISDGREFYYKDGNITQIVDNDRINTKYFSYLFKSDILKRQYMKGSTGTAQVALTIEKLNNLVIPIGDLEIQQKIVNVLDKAQSLIDKRKDQIEALDELVKSRFIEIFGDPVLNPKGWEKGQIADIIIKTQYGTSNKADEQSGKFKILRMNNITYHGKWDFSSMKYIDLDEKEQKKYLVYKGEVLFNRTNSKELVGKTAVYKEDEPMAYAGYLVKAIPNERATGEFIAAYMNTKYVKSKLFNMAKNIVGMANINAEEFKKIDVYIPPIKLQNEYINFVNQVDKLKFEMEKSLKELEDNFNSLMQRAFKGEV
ncbi:restriction endonuclease subunit S [Clostridium botulinum]|uniref:restriction endonuclease subunit S n=1 Tax=Clostridium botulinum TaxID=1491 RepID=UPI003DA34A2A